MIVPTTVLINHPGQTFTGGRKKTTGYMSDVIEVHRFVNFVKWCDKNCTDKFMLFPAGNVNYTAYAVIGEKDTEVFPQYQAYVNSIFGFECKRDYALERTKSVCVFQNKTDAVLFKLTWG